MHNYIKKSVVFCLALALLILFMGTGKVSIAAESTTIKVGYMPNFTIIDNEKIRGSEGYGYEYLREISRLTDLQFDYVPCNWEEGVELLKKGEIDLLAPSQFAVNEEFLETKNDLGSMNAVILAGEEENIAYNDYEAIDGKRVGVIKNSIYEQLFLEY